MSATRRRGGSGSATTASKRSSGGTRSRSKKTSRRKPDGLEVVRRNVYDPVRFVHTYLGHKTWWKQDEILRAMTAPRARVAVKAASGCSKTYSAAELVPWWLSMWDDGKVVTTAPVYRHVRRVLWPYIRQFMREARLGFPEANEVDATISEQRFAIGLATKNANHMKGFHGHILLIIDESPGVGPEVFEAVDSIRAAGDVRVLMLGNPTVPGGPYYEAFAGDSATWRTITINAFDTPNLRPIVDAAGLDPYSAPDEALVEALLAAEPAAPPWPELVAAGWVREKVGEWYRTGHPFWDAYVMGRFPPQSEHALYSLAWIEAAKSRELAPAERDRVEAGIDVAGPGEAETVVYIRRGPAILDYMATEKADPRGDVVAYLRKWEPKRVKVDAAGIGYNFALHLDDKGFPVEQVNVGERAEDPERFRLLRDEVHWGLRDRLEAGRLAGLDDKETIGQLAGILYRINPRGQVEVESKEDMARRGIKSPDRAEALMLAFAPSRAVETGVGPVGEKRAGGRSPWEVR